MELQSSQKTDKSIIPAKWQKRYLIKRIGSDDDIEISEEQRNAIVALMNKGQHHVQLGEYTLMLSGIRSIDPKYPPNNVPPRPTEEYTTEIVAGVAMQAIKNQAEIDMWEKLYGK